MEIKNVIVPTDFSVPAKMAVSCGVALARKFRARLTLVHVIDIRSRFAGDADIDREAEQELAWKAAQELSTLVSPEDEDDLDLQTIVKYGNVHREIVNTIKEQRSDFIVLGTQGRGCVGRLIVGSTTERLLRKLTIPTLVVRTTGPTAFKDILFATDLSESSVHAFDFALDLGRTLQSRILAVHVLDKTMGSILKNNGVPEAHEHVLQDVNRKLATLSAEGKRNGVDVQTLLVEGKPAAEILQISKKYGANLILLAISAKGSLERALFGETAETIVRESTMPVLSIPTHIMA